jgi:hypothetical protein
MKLWSKKAMSEAEKIFSDLMNTSPPMIAMLSSGDRKELGRILELAMKGEWAKAQAKAKK